MRISMRVFGKLIVAALFIFAVLQLVRPIIPAKPATAEIQAPPEVKQILEKDCYSCHSDERRLAWFDQIVPGYWLVRHDILTAREHLNFSTVGSKPAAVQKAALYEAVNMMQLGAMPLPSFLKLHPDAKVTSEELTTLKTYLAPWTPSLNPIANATSASASGTPVPVPLAAVQPEFNEFPFEPTFESWKLISTTDRGDNRTFRFILGNDVAVKAAQAGNISPWPDGTRFAKIAWQQELGPDGLVHPGKFVQVELMPGCSSLQRHRGLGLGSMAGSGPEDLWRGRRLRERRYKLPLADAATTCVYTLPI